MKPCDCVFILVSIPRRYAKNYSSLINLTPILRFQSLVGTLKTQPEQLEEDIKQQFQSLVGTLKTRRFFYLIPFCRVVSIPRRYAKNETAVPGECRTRPQVSIPRRYAKNGCPSSLSR